MRIVLMGGRGHASDVLGAWEALVDAGRQPPGASVMGYLADGELVPARFEGRSLPHLGGIDAAAEVGATHFIAAVGYPAARSKLALLAERAGLLPLTLVHPRAIVPATARVEAGSVVLAGAILSPHTRLGRHVLVGQGAIVGHDCRVGDFTSIMPGACISGDTFIGAGCLVGTHATVLEKRRVEDAAAVGAGAVVTRDVPAGVTVVGVPARPRGEDA